MYAIYLYREVIFAEKDIISQNLKQKENYIVYQQQKMSTRSVLLTD